MAIECFGKAMMPIQVQRLQIENSKSINTIKKDTLINSEWLTLNKHTFRHKTLLPEVDIASIMDKNLREILSQGMENDDEETQENKPDCKSKQHKYYELKDEVCNANGIIVATLEVETSKCKTKDIQQRNDISKMDENIVQRVGNTRRSIMFLCSIIC